MVVARQWPTAADAQAFVHQHEKAGEFGGARRGPTGGDQTVGEIGFDAGKMRAGDGNKIIIDAGKFGDGTDQQTPQRGVGTITLKSAVEEMEL